MLEGPTKRMLDLELSATTVIPYVSIHIFVSFSKKVDEID